MSGVYDRQRALAVRLASRFYVPATITAVIPGARNRVTDAITPGSTIVTNITAKIGSRKVITDDGVEHVQSIAKIDGPAKAGDILKIGLKTFTIVSVEENAPDGGVPIGYTAVLK